MMMTSYHYNNDVVDDEDTLKKKEHKIRKWLKISFFTIVQFFFLSKFDSILLSNFSLFHFIIFNFYSFHYIDYYLYLFLIQSKRNKMLPSNIIIMTYINSNSSSRYIYFIYKYKSSLMKNEYYKYMTFKKEPLKPMMKKINMFFCSV